MDNFFHPLSSFLLPIWLRGAEDVDDDDDQVQFACELNNQYGFGSSLCLHSRIQAIWL